MDGERELLRISSMNIRFYVIFPWFIAASSILKCVSHSLKFLMVKQRQQAAGNEAGAEVGEVTSSTTGTKQREAHGEGPQGWIFSSKGIPT